MKEIITIQNQKGDVLGAMTPNTTGDVTVSETLRALENITFEKIKADSMSLEITRFDRNDNSGNIFVYTQLTTGKNGRNKSKQMWQLNKVSIY